MSKNNSTSLPFWSFRAGYCLGLQIRISFLFPILAGLLFYWFGLRLGFAFLVTLTFAVIVHELGRILGAVARNSHLDTVHLWPFGGLDTSRSDAKGDISSHWKGWLANVFVCALLAWPMLRAGYFPTALNPFLLSDYKLADDAWFNAAYLVFSMNWLLVLVNLIPLEPFDVGVFIRSCLDNKPAGSSRYLIVTRTQWIAATLLFVFGLGIESVAVVSLALCAMLALMSRPEREVEFDVPDERFLGYDFSEGYTSLERSGPETEPSSIPPPTMLERWRLRREESRRQQREEWEREVSEQLDRILEKVHQTGLESLTELERRMLDDASLRYRERGSF